MRQICRDIFAVDESSKWQQAITRDNYRGNFPFGFFTPNDGSGTPDKYEGYKLHAEIGADDPVTGECPLHAPNRWPREIPQARDLILAY